eukprot:364731-Chlamydomonas_euryale.AAC.10
MHLCACNDQAHLITAAKATAQHVNRLASIARPHHLAAAAGIHKLGHLVPRLLVRCCRPRAEVVHASVHIGVARMVVIIHGRQHHLGLLARCSVVKVDQRLAIDLLIQDAEFGPQGSSKGPGRRRHIGGHLRAAHRRQAKMGRVRVGRVAGTLVPCHVMPRADMDPCQRHIAWHGSAHRSSSRSSSSGRSYAAAAATRQRGTTPPPVHDCLTRNTVRQVGDSPPGRTRLARGARGASQTAAQRREAAASACGLAASSPACAAACQLRGCRPNHHRRAPAQAVATLTRAWPY